MRLAIEERELNKMAALEKQDIDLNNLLQKRKEEIEEKDRKLTELEKTVEMKEKESRSKEEKLQKQLKVGVSCNFLDNTLF